MKVTTRFLMALICAALFSNFVASQVVSPRETRNAALRYWIAFADLQDHPTDKQTQDLLEKTANGDAAWDETRLGPVLDANETAILEMQRATVLPECDWGLEYSLGPRASIAPVVKARVMARLNTLYGVRMAARGEMQQAMDAWLSGIRFSRHMASGGSLIFALIAKMSLVSNMKELQLVAQSGKLSPSQRAEAVAVLRDLPVAGLDWSNALSFEAASLAVALEELKKEPSAYYEKLTGKPAPQSFTAPTAAEIKAYRAWMFAVQEALQKSPQQTERELGKLESEKAALHIFFRETSPSFRKLNDARKDVEFARQAALKALTSA